jgi:hypothetical protein
VADAIALDVDGEVGAHPLALPVVEDEGCSGVWPVDDHGRAIVARGWPAPREIGGAEPSLRAAHMSII